VGSMRICGKVSTDQWSYHSIHLTSPMPLLKLITLSKPEPDLFHCRLSCAVLRLFLTDTVIHTRLTYITMQKCFNIEILQNSHEHFVRCRVHKGLAHDHARISHKAQDVNHSLDIARSFLGFTMAWQQLVPVLDRCSAGCHWLN